MKKRIIILAAVLTLILIGFFYARSRDIVGFKKGHFIVRVNTCEDYCPKEIYENSWSRDFRGIKDAEECREIGGYPRKSFAWGGIYKGCSADYIAPQDQYGN